MKIYVLSLNENSTDPTWIVLDGLPIIVEVDSYELDDYGWVPEHCKEQKHWHIKELLETYLDKEKDDIL